MGEPEIESHSGKEVWKKISSLSDIQKKSVFVFSSVVFVGLFCRSLWLLSFVPTKKHKAKFEGLFWFLDVYGASFFWESLGRDLTWKSKTN